MRIAKLLSLLAVISIATSSVTLTLTISDLTINALANYTWELAFSPGSARNYLALTFPAPIAMTSSSLFKYNGINNLNPQGTNTSLFANFTPTANSTFAATITMVVTNVRNPSSGVTRNGFLVTTNLQSFTGLPVSQQITFSPGSFTNCPFTFSLCTQQPNSELTVAVSLVNPLITTNSRFVISYPFVWPGLNKGLGTDTTTLTVCSVSLDGNTSIVTGAICSIDKNANQIIVLFSVNLAIPTANKTFVFKVGGVNAPPTQTISGSSFKVATTDDAGNEIDSKTGCTINPVCITNLTNGQLSNTLLKVNAPYNRPDFIFNTNLLITVLGGDTIDVYYTPFSDLNTCTIFKYWRISSSMMISYQVITSSNFYNITVVSGYNTYNSDFNNPIFAKIQCVSFKMPVSETPSIFTFRFRRSGIQYLELNTTIKAVAVQSNYTQAILFVDQLEMGLTANYQFTIKLGQPLGSTPRIVLSFPIGIGISGTSSNISLSAGASASISNSSIDTASNTLNLLISGSSLLEGTNITITVNGIVNARVPTTYFIGYTTYYDSLATSRVQYNNSAFNATLTAVTTTPVTLLPTSMTVYTMTPITITFTNPINLPSFSNFFLQFPNDVTLLQVSAIPITSNNQTVTLNGTSTTTSNTLSFTTITAIPINSSVIISLSVRTPSIMNNYSFVKLTISSGGVNYLLSHNTMQLIVDKVASQAFTLVPQLSKAGASSAYLFTLTLSVPHPGNFTVLVEVPTDASMQSSAPLCSINCTGAVSPVSNTFSFIVTNSNPNSAIPVNINFLISNFTNPRSTGAGLPWILTTLGSLGGSIITKQSASPHIALPNTITASLSLNEQYYRSNTNPVKIRMTFFNQLLPSDQILLTMDTTTYTVNPNINIVNCTNSLGNCSRHFNSTTGLLIVKVQPVLSQIINGTYDLILQGLISGANTGYLQTDFITVRTYTSGGLMIDNGTMPYNISCRENAILPKSCRRCSNTSCIDCYVSNGFYLNGTTCVTSCGDATKFMSFANVTNGSCQTCINNCATCTSSTVCITCLNTSSYYLYTNNFSCLLMCQNNSGYVTSTLDNRPICSPCFDSPLCLECSSTASGACIKCTSNSFFFQGSCFTNCSNPMLYNFNGVCLPCNTSCSTCSGPGNTACILCAVGYVNSSGKCQPSCDNGSAVMPSTNLCGCDPTCTFCESSNYFACTLCATPGQFVWQGKCISTCPNSTYSTSSACISCSIGCTNCTATTCSTCQSGWLLYNNYCVTDCNLISQQYDQQGLICVLCPDGCDSCSGVACKSCLSEYSLSGNQCVKTCLLYNNCDVSSNQVIPLPGFISLALWTAIVLIMRFISHKNYVPYSIILFSCVIEFILVIALLGVTDSAAIARLLVGVSYAYRNTMKALLALSIIFNYLSNAAYIFIFIRYLRPLMNNPKQIDFIANLVVLVVAALTNYRFALIAFARMFPKPNIYVDNGSKLTPVHYLCVCSIILDLFAIIAGGLGVYNKQPKTDMFMLSLDLLMIIIVNIAISIWFVSSTKSQDYFEDEIKKYHIEQHNVTAENLPNDKEKSKSKMIVNDSVIFYDDDIVEQSQKSPDKGDSYKKITAEQIKIQEKQPINDHKENDIMKSGKDNISEGFNSGRLPKKIVREQPTKDQLIIIDAEASKPSRYDPQNDVNFQKNIKPKRGMSNSAHKLNISTVVPSNQPIVKQTSPSSNGKSILTSMQQSARSDRKKQKPNRDIEQIIQQSEIPDLQQNSDAQEIVFQKKEKLIRPKRVGTQKAFANTNKISFEKTLEDSRKMTKSKRIGYLESDAFESNAQFEDLETIIKQKVFQNTTKLERPKEKQQESNEQTGYEQMSPSWFNIQNQRLDISDMDDQESQP